MKKNVGSIDKVLRFVAALALVLLYMFDILTGSLALVVMGVLALVFVGTALVGYCPLYTIFGFSSCPMAEESTKPE